MYIRVHPWPFHVVVAPSCGSTEFTEVRRGSIPPSNRPKEKCGKKKCAPYSAQKNPSPTPLPPTTSNYSTKTKNCAPKQTKMRIYPLPTLSAPVPLCLSAFLPTPVSFSLDHQILRDFCHFSKAHLQNLRVIPHLSPKNDQYLPQNKRFSPPPSPLRAFVSSWFNPSPRLPI